MNKRIHNNNQKYELQKPHHGYHHGSVNINVDDGVTGAAVGGLAAAGGGLAAAGGITAGLMAGLMAFLWVILVFVLPLWDLDWCFVSVHQLLQR